MTCPSHYFDQDPSTSHAYGQYEIFFGGVNFIFETDRSVFSRQHMDPGSQLLLKTVLKDWEDRPLEVLDLGTGIGVLAVVLARLRPLFQVTASDINERAVRLAAKNAVRAGVKDRVRTLALDGVPPGSYDLVLTNPPIRAGKETVYGLFGQVAAALAPGGSFYVVIRVKQGADSARRELERLFDGLETMARSKGYHVLRAWKEE
ncbi:MAG: methyltransferase [Saccharofermentanales bacterium]